jgi:hypothetical protein
MSLRILSHIQSFDIDMQKNKLQNAVVDPLASAPASPVAGQIYYNNVSNDLFFYNGTTWVSSAGVTSITAGNGISVSGTSTVTVTNATVGYASTAKSGTAVTLTSASASRQVFTGTATQALTLPSIATLYVGWSVAIINDNSQGDVNVSAVGPISLGPVAGGQIVRFVCTTTTGAENEGWNILYEGSYSATGSDALVYSNSPVLTTPNLGTPSNVILTNGTNLPIVGGTTGTLTVARGGTGQTSFTANGILYGSAGNALSVTAAGSQHQVLLAGAGGVPAFGALNLSQGAAVTGTLPVASGGTGTNSGSITGTGALTFTSAAGNNNVNLVPTGTGSVDVASKKITNVADPTAATDAANKQYVDGVAQGLDVKASVKAATTANIAGTYANGSSGVGATLTVTFQGALSIDGVSVNTIGDRLLVKDQSTAAQNGIYTVTTVGGPGVSPVLTRATDFDVNTEIPGAFTFVETGTTNQDRGFVCTTDAGATIGTTNITFVQFSSAGSFTAGTGIDITSNTISLATGNVLSLHNLAANGFVVRNGNGTVTNRTIAGTGSAPTSQGAGYGGGITVSNGDGVSGNPTIALKSFSAQGPSSTANSWSVTHNLNSENLIVTLREAGAGKELVLADTVFTDNNSLSFSFAASQNANTLRVSILRVD